MMLANTILVTKQEEEDQYFETLDNTKGQRLSNDNLNNQIVEKA